MLLAAIDGSRHAGHPDEAEGWYKRALELQEQVQRGDLSHAHCLSDLATLVVSEVGKGHASKARLTEAKNYSQQSLTFMEQLDTSLDISPTLHTLARIAEMEGQHQVAQNYYRRARESYALYWLLVHPFKKRRTWPARSLVSLGTELD